VAARLSLSAALFALVLALHVWIELLGSFPGDRWALDSFGRPSTQPGLVQDITGFYQALGTPAFAIALAVIATWMLWRRGLQIELAGLATAWSAVLVNILLKSIYGPTAPWLAAGHSGSNFPSGHTTFATAVIGYLGLLAHRRRQRELALVAAVVVIGMGPMRVIRGTHLVSDVVGGYCLGVAGLLLAGVVVSVLKARAGAPSGRPLS